jgi:hypothetical protein
MPQCPHCQVPYEVGQRYCSTCGSFLMHPEQGDTFCPQCGVRVSPRQEFCHECDAPLKGGQVAPGALGPAPETKAAAVPETAPAPAPSSGMPSWLIGLMVGSGILILILLILLFTRGTSTPPAPTPAPKAETPAPALPAPAPKAEAPAPVSPAAPPAPSPAPETAPLAEADLKEQLQKELTILRDAQLRKDIAQFMSVYSLTYPELDDKRASALKSWENYDFTNLVFTLDKIQSIDTDNAIAWVTWYMDTKNRRTHALASSSQIFQVRFAKEQGKWRIRSLEEVEP